MTNLTSIIIYGKDRYTEAMYICHLLHDMLLLTLQIMVFIKRNICKRLLISPIHQDDVKRVRYTGHEICLTGRDPCSADE